MVFKGFYGHVDITEAKTDKLHRTWPLGALVEVFVVLIHLYLNGNCI